MLTSTNTTTHKENSMEIWMPLKECDGYEVSSKGNVRSFKLPGRQGGRSTYPKTIKQYKATNGYLMFSVSIKSKCTTIYTHMKVAELFIGPRPEGMEVCHADGTRDNNRLSNLRYDTRSANAEDSRRHGTLQQGEKHGRSIFTMKQVREIRARNLEGETGASLAREYGVDYNTIWRIVKGISYKE